MRLVAAFCCLVALSLVAGVGAADSQVAIEDGPTDETLGDVVELTVSVPENGTATVLVEATGDLEYRRQVTMTDTSGDGEIRLSLNRTSNGHEPGASWAP
jgi:hypothetical protein